MTPEFENITNGLVEICVTGTLDEFKEAILRTTTTHTVQELINIVRNCTGKSDAEIINLVKDNYYHSYDISVSEYQWLGTEFNRAFGHPCGKDISLFNIAFFYEKYDICEFLAETGADVDIYPLIWKDDIILFRRFMKYLVPSFGTQYHMSRCGPNLQEYFGSL